MQNISQAHTGTSMRLCEGRKPPGTVLYDIRTSHIFPQCTVNYLVCFTVFLLGSTATLKLPGYPLKSELGYSVLAPASHTSLRNIPLLSVCTPSNKNDNLFR